MRTNLRSEQRFNALENGDLRYSSCCDAPAPPNLAPIQAASDRAAELAYQTAGEDLAFRKQVWEESRPRHQQLYELASKVANQQLGVTEETAARARQQWNEYDQTYLPVERRMAQEAMDYDSPERRERLRGEAMAETAAALGIAEGGLRRSLSRYGVNPASGRYQGQARMARLSGAASIAGAGNTAVRGLEDRGIALRAGAAGFGRNQVNAAGQSFGLSTQTGSSAVANQNAGFMSGLPYAQFQTGAYGTQLGAAGLAQHGALGMGNIMSRDYATAMQGYGAEMAGWGQLAGMGLKLFGPGSGGAPG